MVDHLWAVRDAMRRGCYEEALAAQHAFFADFWYRQQRSRPMPFADSRQRRALSILPAIFDDEDLMGQMEDAVATGLISANEIVTMRQEAAAIAFLKEEIERSGLVPVSVLKAAATPSGGRRTSQLLDWMSKANIIWIERREVDIAHWGPTPEDRPAATQELPPFSLRSERARVTQLWVDQCPVRRLPGSDYLHPKDLDIQESAPDSIVTIETARPLESRLRHVRVMRTLPHASGTWLATTPRPGVDEKTSVTRVGLDGNEIDRFNWNHPAVRLHTGPDRVVVLASDLDLNVRMYDAESAQALFEASFSELPEVRAAVSLTHEQPHNVVPTIDADVATDLVIVPVLDTVWAFGLDGTPRWAVKVPAVPASGSADECSASRWQEALSWLDLEATATIREVASYLQRTGAARGIRIHAERNGIVEAMIHTAVDPPLRGRTDAIRFVRRVIGPLLVDRIKKVRIVTATNCVAIITRSGLAFNASIHDGSVSFVNDFGFNAWPELVLADDRKLMVSTLHGTFCAPSDGLRPLEPLTPPLRGRAAISLDQWIGQNVLVATSGDRVRITDLSSRKLIEVQGARDLRAIVALRHTVRLDFARKRLNVRRLAPDDS